MKKILHELYKKTDLTQQIQSYYSELDNCNFEELAQKLTEKISEKYSASVRILQEKGQPIKIAIIPEDRDKLEQFIYKIPVKVVVQQ